VRRKPYAQVERAGPPRGRQDSPTPCRGPLSVAPRERGQSRWKRSSGWRRRHSTWFPPVGRVISGGFASDPGEPGSYRADLARQSAVSKLRSGRAERQTLKPIRAFLLSWRGYMACRRIPNVLAGPSCRRPGICWEPRCSLTQEEDRTILLCSGEVRARTDRLGSSLSGAEGPCAKKLLSIGPIGAKTNVSHDWPWSPNRRRVRKESGRQ